MRLRDIISPFYAWKRALEKPFTIARPVAERPGAPRYRGFHVNDTERCVGCGTCARICQNAAIDMAAVDGRETVGGDSGLRPRIDYGRCCWCALCVDICPTSSLGMSNEYNWISHDGEDWIFTPGEEKKPWDGSQAGYRSTEDTWLLDPGQRRMPVLEPANRRKIFDEVSLGYDDGTAVAEATRCIECGLCIEACPTHMDVPDYIRSIREGRLDEGLRILYETNPFSETCGRVCTARCQEVCPLGARGEPIAIRWLKRVITDRTADRGREILGIGSERSTAGAKVAVIGGGPAGLTAAFYLRRYGYRITLFERHETLGGMLRFGIPGYRLPDEVLDREIELILDTGIEVRRGTSVGVDIGMDDLVEEFNAIFVAVGAQSGSVMPIEGLDEPGIEIGIDFLHRIARGERPNLGAKVAVVGGGNTAMDVCRTAVRLGADEVTVLYRRTEREMPANEEEIEEAREEGVRFEFLVTPKGIVRSGGKLLVECLRMELGEPDDSGRRRPVPIEGSEFTVETDTCVMAVGQQVESGMPLPDGVRLTRWGTFVVDPDTLGTGAGGVFAGGDCETGPDDAIRAIAAGKKAAHAIHLYLSVDTAAGGRDKKDG